MEHTMKVRIVPMNGDHLDEVAELERVCFPDPWSRNMLKEELENDLAAFLVALDEQGTVAGYAGLQVVLDEGYILNVAVTVNNTVAVKLMEGLEIVERAGRLYHLVAAAERADGEIGEYQRIEPGINGTLCVALNEEHRLAGAENHSVEFLAHRCAGRQNTVVPGAVMSIITAHPHHACVAA